MSAHTGWARINPPLQILPTSFISDALSIAYPDVLLGADSESALTFHSRAKLEPLRDLSSQGSLLLAHVQSGRTSYCVLEVVQRVVVIFTEEHLREIEDQPSCRRD